MMLTSERSSLSGLFEEDSPADKMVSAVESAYLSGGIKIGFSPTKISGLLGGPFASLLTLLTTDSSQATAEANYRKLADNIKTWRTTYRDWAEASRRDDGTAYSWSQWSQFGTELLTTIQQQTGYVLGTDVGVTSLVVAVNDGKNALDNASSCLNHPFKCAMDNVPAWVFWVGGGLAALFVISQVANLRKALK
jgi:hypothetical protein